jgi:hypothetical protein
LDLLSDWASALFGLRYGADFVPVIEVDQPDALSGSAGDFEIKETCMKRDHFSKPAGDQFCTHLDTK